MQSHGLNDLAEVPERVLREDDVVADQSERHYLAGAELGDDEDFRQGEISSLVELIWSMEHVAAQTLPRATCS